MYILEGPILEPPALRSKYEHDARWKHHYDVEDVSNIILETTISVFREVLLNLKAYHSFLEVKHIFLNAMLFV